MGLSRSERNEDRRDARLKRRQALEAKAQAEAKKSTSSRAQQSNTNLSKSSVQKASVDRVDISEAARNLAATVPKQAQTSNNTGVKHGPPIPAKTEMTWGEASSEASVSASLSTLTNNAAEKMLSSIISDSTLPGTAGKIVAVGTSTADVYYDAAANLSKGDTKFGSNKSISQSFTEAVTGAIISKLGSSALVNAIAVSPAYMKLTPQKDKTIALMASLGTGYVLSLADSKIGVSPGVAEFVEREKGRVKESGKKINEYITQSNKKTYRDFTYKEKQAIDKYMNNVTYQNDRILKAKVDWEAANRIGDKDGKEKAKAVAKDAREKGGMLSRETSIDRIKELNEKIQKEKEKYREAEKIKDKAKREKAQDEAHERANAYRTQGGLSRFLCKLNQPIYEKVSSP
ncbi:hypothetical protein HP567_020540 [Brevibacillus sp. M2.1A]|uniref:hypothetical protein n=1 Tax=unclassified Brevibacillus TaxID=2684853 RepID=UPI00156B6D15|nr:MULTISPECIES: hypothetical protein [unclassified Brevibacillus]MCC8436939.1 hypothetical protein [Brevibacillus sp. M2.1A]MCE0449533.1 hypothetical protein [Brevibacillus sp. AF8]